MGFLRGIKAIDKHLEAAEERRNSAGKKVDYLSMKDGEAVKITFLQELDPDSDLFSEKNDLGILAIEHTAGANFRKKAMCSMEDEGKCFACEMHRKTNYKEGWGQKTNLYINVLVDDGKEDPRVAVLQKGKTFLNLLLEEARDPERKGITEKVFTLKRKGSGTDTIYILRPGQDNKLDLESFELFDLKTIVRDVPYAQQEAFYLDEPVEAASEATQPQEPALSTSEW